MTEHNCLPSGLFDMSGKIQRCPRMLGDMQANSRAQFPETAISNYGQDASIGQECWQSISAPG